MDLYFQLIDRIPEFGAYDTMEEIIYVECKVSPLGTIGHWLNHLVKDPKSNEELIHRIRVWLNDIYREPGIYSSDVRNYFGIYLFCALDYPTIRYIKKYLDKQILADGRAYLRFIDQHGYQDF